MAIGSVIRSVVRPSVATSAGVYGSPTPSYLIDFAQNYAIINRVNVGAVANIPSLSGTLNLVATGQRIAGASNGLIIPLSGVTYPLTFMIGFIRSTDSGGTEVVALLDAGSAANMTLYRIDAADQLRLRVDASSANQCNVGGGTLLTSVPTSVQRAAGRIAANSVQNCRNGTLGGEDTSVTLPTNPTRLVIGVDSAGARTFDGDIAFVKIFPGISTDATLQGLTSGLA